MKNDFIIVGIVLTAVGLMIFAGALIAAGFDFSRLATAKYETNTLTADGEFDKIEIYTKSTDIVFKQSDNGEFSAVIEETSKVKHAVSVTDGTLSIAAEDKRTWIDHISFFQKSLTMTLYLPSSAFESLKIECGTGDVSVPDFLSFGNAEISVSTGDVIFKAPECGALKIKTSTGDIKLDGIHAESVDLSVSTGKIEGKNITSEGALSARVSTGKTELTDVICKSFASKGTTGAITLKDVIAADFIKIERSTGDVRFENSDAEEIFVTASTGDVTGTLRTPKTFIANTSTGKKKLPETTGGECRITTTTGDIIIELSVN
ncbi:MAG: DUF4097 family beta strand repeat protein [Clostridia bacterium]|nr:DUF4097 family beta strand repeat protein [Clostridia bacterium]